MITPLFARDDTRRRDAKARAGLGVGARTLTAALAACVATGACAARHHSVTAPGAPVEVAEMRAACKGWLWWDGARHRFEVAYALRPPDSLYAEFAGRIGGTQAILSVAQGRLLVLIPGERRFLQEEATAATFEALFGLRLEAPDLVSILGSAGMRRDFTVAGSAPLEVRVDGKELRVELQHGAATDDGTGAFERLELRFQEIERPPIVPIEGSLFEVPIPATFARIGLEGDRNGPLLLP